MGGDVGEQTDGQMGGWQVVDRWEHITSGTGLKVGPTDLILPTFRIWRLLAPSVSYQRATAVLDSGTHSRGLADSLAHRKPTWLMFS